MANLHTAARTGSVLLALGPDKRDELAARRLPFSEAKRLHSSLAWLGLEGLKGCTERHAAETFEGNMQQSTCVLARRHIRASFHLHALALDRNRREPSLDIAVDARYTLLPISFILSGTVCR